MGYNKRTSWSEGEKTIILEHFGEYIENEVLPSSETLACLIKKSPVLKNRNELQLKSWISNRIQKKGKALTPKDTEVCIYIYIFI